MTFVIYSRHRKHHGSVIMFSRQVGMGRFASEEAACCQCNRLNQFDSKIEYFYKPESETLQLPPRRPKEDCMDLFNKAHPPDAGYFDPFRDGSDEPGDWLSAQE